MTEIDPLKARVEALEAALLELDTAVTQAQELLVFQNDPEAANEILGDASLIAPRLLFPHANPD